MTKSRLGGCKEGMMITELFKLSNQELADVYYLSSLNDLEIDEFLVRLLQF